MATAIDEKDRIRINAFLVSNAGRALVVWLREPEQRPKIRAAAQPHETQMDAGAQNGYDECIRKMESFIHPAKPAPMDDGTPALRNTRRLTRT